MLTACIWTFVMWEVARGMLRPPGGRQGSTLPDGGIFGPCLGCSTIPALDNGADQGSPNTVLNP